MDKTNKKVLTTKELTGYREWLAELEKEARDNSDLKYCDSDIMEIFYVKNVIGQQIYMSFSDEELLDCILRTTEPPSPKIRYENMYCIYKLYAKARFGSLETASKLAISRRKQLKNQAKWPSDWPDRVSVEPALEKLRQRKKELTNEDIAFLERICKMAKSCGVPPVLSPEEMMRMNMLTNWKYLYEWMGIPALTKRERVQMVRYWQQERKRSLEVLSDEKK